MLNIIAAIKRPATAITAQGRTIKETRGWSLINFSIIHSLRFLMLT